MLAPEGAEVKAKEFLGPMLRYNQKKYQRLAADLRKRGWVLALDHCEERAEVCSSEGDGQDAAGLGRAADRARLEPLLRAGGQRREGRGGAGATLP